MRINWKSWSTFYICTWCLTGRLLSSCQRVSTFSFLRHRPTQRLKMVLTCSHCCWRLPPVTCASVFFYKERQNQVYRNDLCLLYFLHSFCICKIFLCASTTKGLKMVWAQIPVSLNDDVYLSGYLSSGYFSGIDLIFDHVDRQLKTSAKSLGATLYFASQVIRLEFLWIAHNKNYRLWITKAYLLFVLLQKQVFWASPDPPPLIFGIILARTKALSSHLKIYSPITK